MKDAIQPTLLYFSSYTIAAKAYSKKKSMPLPLSLIRYTASKNIL